MDYIKFNAYNVAIKYLINKYGENSSGSFGLIDPNNHNDIQMGLLLNQYQYGTQAKKELYYLLVEMEILKS